MGAKTEIAWTDHTFNPWWGCNKVSAGCDHCYAATFAGGRGGYTGKTDIRPSTADEN
jgi:protein gp37